MYPSTIRREAPLSGIFHANSTSDEGFLIENRPICGYRAYIDPAADMLAVSKGEDIVAQMKRGIIADFEKNAAYVEKGFAERIDRMVHVSTFKIIDGMIYMTYYANTATDAEDPLYQESRLAFCPEDDPAQMTIVTVQKAGETLDGKRIDRVYDTILLYKGGDELFLLWTASADGLYYRLYCAFNMATRTLSAIHPNRFQVGCIVNDFSTTGIATALSANGKGHKAMFSDIGIMQKITSRTENGETWYYTGAYSGHLNCVIKSRDFVTWEYVSEPPFPNMSL